MARNRRVNIDLYFNSRGAVQGARVGKRSIKGVGDEADRAGKKVAGFGSTFKKAFAALITVGAVAKVTSALRNLAVRGIRYLNDAIQLAGIQQIADQKLSRAIANTGASVDKWLPKLRKAAQELQRVSNFGDEVTMTAQAMLLSFSDVAGPEGAILLTRSLGDMAAGLAAAGKSGGDLNQMAAALGKALTTGATALKRYGISLSAQQEAAFNAARGLDRVRILVEIIESNFGGLAEATADPFKQLQNAASDAGEAIAHDLLPQVRGLAKFITEGLASEAGGAFVKVLSVMLSLFANWALDVVTQTVTSGLYLLNVFQKGVVGFVTVLEKMALASLAVATATGNTGLAVAIGQAYANIVDYKAELERTVQTTDDLIGATFRARQRIRDLAAEYKNAGPINIPGGGGDGGGGAGGGSGAGGSFSRVGRIPRPKIPRGELLEILFGSRTFDQVEQTAVPALRRLSGEAESTANAIRAAFASGMEDSTNSIAAFVRRAGAHMDAFQDTFREGFDAVMNLQRAHHESRLAQIDEQRNAALNRIDAELNREGLSEERRNELLKQREDALARFRESEAAEMQRQAKFEKRMAIFRVIIETAADIVKAFPNFLLMGKAAALGAVQVATIAAQPIPQFALGGFVPGYGGGTDSVLARVTPGEFVVRRRPAQQNRALLRAINGGGGSGPLARDIADALANTLRNEPLVADIRDIGAGLRRHNRERTRRGLD